MLLATHRESTFGTGTRGCHLQTWFVLNEKVDPTILLPQYINAGRRLWEIIRSLLDINRFSFFCAETKLLTNIISQIDLLGLYDKDKQDI